MKTNGKGSDASSAYKKCVVKYIHLQGAALQMSLFQQNEESGQTWKALL